MAGVTSPQRDAVTLTLAVPDLISPSYFPAIAAVELGCMADRGVEVELQLRFPVTDAMEALRAGEIDLLAGASHTLFHREPDGGGVVLLAALARHTYWFLVVRPDLGLRRGDPLGALQGRRIGAAPGPVDALLQLLSDGGVEPGSVDIGPVPGTKGAGVSFGVTAAKALADGTLDGFWANGMGAEVAVRAGSGLVVIDSRRGDGPPGTSRYTFPALMATRALIERRPEEVGAAVAGLVDAQAQLRHDPNRATPVAERLFPPMEAGLTAELIARDAPFYDPAITAEDVTAVVTFARHRGLTNLELRLDDVVSHRYRSLWSSMTAADPIGPAAS